jgi:hypothetical protein
MNSVFFELDKSHYDSNMVPKHLRILSAIGHSGLKRTPARDRTFCCCRRIIELLFQPRRDTFQPCRDFAGPADVLQSPFNGPVWWRACGDGAEVARLVSQFEDFRAA